MNETNNEDPDDLWEYTATVVSPVPGFVTFTEDTNWAQVPIKFAPPPFVPAGGNLDLYYLPEESLNAFVGQDAFGKWTLEMWDTRAGATNPAPQLLAWQLRFIFDNTVAVPIGLTAGSPGGNSVPPGQMACFFVDVPAWATQATNTLLEASAPVNLFFNQTNPPSGANAGDAILLSAATNGFATLLTGGSPPLVPGARYYLGVQNLGTSSVTAALQVDFGILAIALTNGIPYFNTNSGAGNATDYYLYTVTTNAVRAQFEINSPTAEMSLAVRNGLPPPTLTSYDCLSANPGTNDELIVLFDDSTPVALTPGAWYIAAVNVSTAPASYGIRATEFPVYGTDIVITNSQMLSNSLCLTWTSPPGVKYYVQGKPDLNQTNWTTVSPTLTAAGPLTSYCIPLPSPLNFFRVHEGLVLVPYLPAVHIGSIACSTNQVQLQWTAPANLNFQVQWSASVSPPAWNTFTASVTAINTAYSFIDDGSESGGLTGPRYYRLQQVP
jgi:hypothetical protein